MPKEINLGRVRGAAATINGFAAVTLEGGDNVRLIQEGNNIRIDTNLPSTSDTVNNDNRLPTGAAVTAALEGKQDKISATAGEIAVVANNGSGITSSGFKISTNLQNSDMSVPTGSAVSTAVNNAITTAVTTAKREIAAGAGSDVDTSLSTTSDNPVQNKVITNALNNKQDKLTIDTAMSSTSPNPVQNKTIQAALNTKMDKVTGAPGQVIGFDSSGNPVAQTSSAGGSSITVDTSLSGSSTNPVQNNVIKNALDAKLNTSSVDASLSTSSSNPVRNSVITNALNNKQDKISGTSGRLVTIAPSGSGIAASSYSVSSTIDNSGSSIPTGSAVYNAIQGLSSTGSTVIVDSTLNSSSRNALENRVIYSALSNKLDKSSVDSSLNSSSTNPVQNKAIYTALDNKLDKSSVDSSLSTSSTNPVRNSVVTSKLNTHDTQISSINSNISSIQTTLSNKQGLISGTSGKVVTVASSGTGITASGYSVSSSLSTSNLQIPTSGAVTTELNNKLNKSDVDSVLSETSTNPVQNKVVFDAINSFNDVELYTFQLNQGSSDYVDCITYTGMNAGYNPAFMDYEHGYFDYGSWLNAFFIKNLKVVVLGYDGKVKYELDPNDYTKKKDGTSSGITSTSLAGNVMIGIPTVWVKSEQLSSNIFAFSIANKKINKDFKAYAHTDADGNIIPYLYIGAYEITNNNRSISGLNPNTYSVSTLLSNINSINTLGGVTNVWGAHTLSTRNLINILLTLISHSLNSQESFGGGYGVASGASHADSGRLNTKGLFWGYQLQSTLNTNQLPVKVFGIENWWGSTEKLVLGLLASEKYLYYKYTYGTQDGSTVTGYSTSSCSGYQKYPDKFVTTSEGSSFLYKMYLTNYGMIPGNISSSGGSATTRYCDYVRLPDSSQTTGVYYCRAWGSAEDPISTRNYRGMFACSLGWNSSCNTYLEARPKA